MVDITAQEIERCAPLDGVRTASRTSGSRIGFEDVSVAYGGLTVLKSLTLTVHPGEIVALIGPSGSGKTTALRVVAGFVRPSSGRIMIGDRDVTDLAPYDRQIGMVVQNYALFPHMRVEDNVAFGLQAQGAPRDVIRQRVPECLAMVGMSAYGKRYPRELSGGQQQRVAIARALAPKPQVLLLDEPLSALDTQIRRAMIDEIAKLHHDLPDLTVLYVTHDQTEALTLANHIGIMRDGEMQAFGEAQALFRHPPTRFAAEFLGRANLLSVGGLTAAGPGEARVRFGGAELLARNPHNLPEGRDCLLCVRPHHMRFAGEGAVANALTGVVQSVQWQGDVHNITLTAEGESLRMTCVPMAVPPALGDQLRVCFDPSEVTLVPEDAPRG
ncbi:ABC transporter ATP-binding protein [Ancylobacter sp. MQZ15Z-1]|uniref:ABC transporter ATP-binding protein n=1 Tax=Ancylobacter mangrovi TaxID=2972472 RepID=A0A9X2T173_9HYPH|nr:ABC transporter ATP-binding protein [Ancylobacter mangrovi]MCS0494422.1 ABC transporter ATP-binding protein [Ancylobacter mangrovi]